MITGPGDITQITNLAALRLWIQPADHAKE
jgi:hypothetical protein